MKTNEEFQNYLNSIVNDIYNGAGRVHIEEMLIPMPKLGYSRMQTLSAMMLANTAWENHTGQKAYFHDIVRL